MTGDHNSNGSPWLMERVAFIAFFLSGASGLIFQLVWTRLLNHVFGSSSIAISSVVSVFMGGLALGSWLAGKYADRLGRPLLLYASAEVGVALCGTVVPWLVRSDGWLAGVNAWLRHSLGAETAGFMVTRFLCILPILIIPTTLMGSTLPLLSRHLVEARDRSEQASRRVGLLYAVNTFGAVSGVFLVAFVLLPNLGVRWSNAIAIFINLFLATMVGAAWRLSPSAASARRPPSDEAAEMGQEPEPEVGVGAGDDIQHHHPPRGARLTAAAAFAVSGAVSMVYEVVWSRALINTIGGSVYSFAIILMTFLVGIAAGSAVASAHLGRRRRSLAPLGTAAAAFCLLASSPLAVYGGARGWGLAALAGVGAVLAVGVAALVQRRSLSRLQASITGRDPQKGWQLVLLAVPCLNAFAVWILHPQRLAAISFTVVLLLCCFLGLLLILRRYAFALLGTMQLFIGAATLASDIWADRFSLVFAGMVSPLYDALPENVNAVMALMCLTVALCVLPAALGMGAMFPLTVRVFSKDGKRIGREVSIVYTGNTLGCVVGAWLAGFALMPTIGMQGALHAGIAANLVLAMALFWFAPARGDARGGAGDSDGSPRPEPFSLSPRSPGAKTSNATAYACLALGPALIALLFLAASRPESPLRWDISRMTMGTFRLSLAKSVLDREAWGTPEVVYYRDGYASTVTVERWGRQHALKNNGKVEASDGSDMPTQIMVSALPLLFHDRGAAGLDVAIVGFGSGVTVGSALEFPVRSVDAAEIEPSVVESSRYFARVNHLTYTSNDYPYVSDPRLTVINDDGRNYLASTRKRYDVIISEPSNPWLAGVSDLFTTDFFRISKRKLRPRGVFCQWVQLYEMSPKNVKVIYRTFASMFRQVVVFSSEELSSDTILLGSDSPLPLDLERLRAGLEPPRVERELERAGIASAFDVLARVLLASREEVLRYARLKCSRRKGEISCDQASTNAEACLAPQCVYRRVPLNTDDNARIEFAAPRDLIAFERYSGYLKTIYAPAWPYGKVSRLLTGFGSGDAAADNYARLAAAQVRQGRRAEAALSARRSRQAGKTACSQSLLHQLSALAGKQPEPRLDHRALSPAESLGGISRARLAQGLRPVLEALDGGDSKQAWEKMKAIPEPLRLHSGPDIRLLNAYLAYKNEGRRTAIQELEGTIRCEEAYAAHHPELFFYLARAYYKARRLDRALANMARYARGSAARTRDSRPAEAK